MTRGMETKCDVKEKRNKPPYLVNCTQKVTMYKNWPLCGAGNLLEMWPWDNHLSYVA